MQHNMSCGTYLRETFNINNACQLTTSRLFRSFTFNTVGNALAPQQNWSDLTPL